jgi:aminoglycoside phosphotransferase (APT) family kinase protein
VDVSRLVSTDVATLTSGLDSWLEQWQPTASAGSRIEQIVRPDSGWSNNTVLLEVGPAFDLDDTGPLAELVVRIAPVPEVASFPVVDFAAEAAVMQAVRRSGSPVPAVLAVEQDRCWVGAPFLVMTKADGHSVGDAPSLDHWLMGLPVGVQRRIHEDYLDALAGIHRLDWHTAGLQGVVRDSGADLAAETAWWVGYIDWAADQRPTPTLAAHAHWCATNAPSTAHARSLSWGDPRLGNVLLLDDGSPAALLDWEMASIGPAEMDLAWYMALDRLTTQVIGTPVPGFLDREQAVARYERHLGRPVEHLEWHEIFALVRSTAINERQARLAQSVDADYPGVPGEDNPLLAYIGRRIARFEQHH